MKLHLTTILLLIVFASYGQSTKRKAPVRTVAVGKARSQEIMPSELIQAGAAAMMGNYDYSAEKYRSFIIGSNDVRLINYANEGIGFAYANTKRYSDAMPFFTQYLSYFNTPAYANDKYGYRIGRALVRRGFCRGMLGDHQGAITDLNKGINWLQIRIKSDKSKNQEFREELGFGYLIRGLQRGLLPGSSPADACSDLRMASELGQERAFQGCYCGKQ